MSDQFIRELMWSGVAVRYLKSERFTRDSLDYIHEHPSSQVVDIAAAEYCGTAEHFGVIDDILDGEDTL